MLVAYRVGNRDLAMLAGLGAFLGHLFPVWLRFNGGKGVATFIGLLIALVWQGALVFCLVWLAVALLTRYSSLAALVASLVTIAFLWFDGYLQEAELFALLTVLMWAKHHANIRASRRQDRKQDRQLEPLESKRAIRRARRRSRRSTPLPSCSPREAVDPPFVPRRDSG